MTRHPHQPRRRIGTTFGAAGATHRLKRDHRLGVIVIEQVRIDRQRRGHLRMSHELAQVQRRDTGRNLP